MLRVVAVVSLCVAAAASRGPSGASANSSPEQQQLRVTGTYHSNYDDVTLSQDGNRVSGTYVCCGGGTIEGKLEGRTVHYVWRQPGRWGAGVWTIGSGRLVGTWGTEQSESNGGRWDLERVAPKAQLAR